MKKCLRVNLFTRPSLSMSKRLRSELMLISSADLVLLSCENEDQVSA